ncbi:indole-3-glycerol phosphate synthase TrpC [Oceanobacillus manasiensis]|uniref:indole-3-glycerol phosphate synthase TrpC n=1 Tax=Oceanobacillus manasiensis TaxID=586413 RepID=UPI0005AA61FD|nr:indole-3-glycerol phosphate synthase TrpC [Oceanobacillus manasiensis]
MTILEKIIAQKEKEVAILLNQTFDQVPSTRQVTPLSKALLTSDRLGIIAEIKRSSPSKGEISATVDPVVQAKQYEANGASAISVLTDKTFFNGSIEDLQAVSNAVNLPILCKDFIIDPVQIDQAKAAGATIILLIVAALNEKKLNALFNYAKERDLEVLCEVHDEKEMEIANKLKPDLIGINNRNLKTFEVDLHTTEHLAKLAKPGSFLVSESGMKSTSDAKVAAKAGAQAILVGETLMRSEDLVATFQSLRVPKPIEESKENAR